VDDEVGDQTVGLGRVRAHGEPDAADGLVGGLARTAGDEDFAGAVVEVVQLLSYAGDARRDFGEGGDLEGGRGGGHRVTRGSARCGRADGGTRRLWRCWGRCER